MTSTDDTLAFGVKKSDFMKNSTHNFIENERYHHNVQSAHPICNRTEVEVQDRQPEVENSNHQKSEKIFSSQKVVEEKIEHSRLHYPKVYTSKCYFKPTQNPISYSETVIVTLGSDKKQYFDTVIYETKLIPFRWVETVRTVVPSLNENVFQAQHEVFIEEPKLHYMSLEPQQIAAAQQAVNQIEVH